MSIARLVQVSEVRRCTQIISFSVFDRDYSFGASEFLQKAGDALKEKLSSMLTLERRYKLQIDFIGYFMDEYRESGGNLIYFAPPKFIWNASEIDGYYNKLLAEVNRQMERLTKVVIDEHCESNFKMNVYLGDEEF